jgi:hypothetical protein
MHKTALFLDTLNSSKHQVGRNARSITNGFNTKDKGLEYFFING